MRHQFRVMLFVALSLWVSSAYALTCPADKECLAPDFTQWCHMLGGSPCALAGRSNQCGDEINSGIGARSYAQQSDVKVAGLVCAAGYDSAATDGPSGPEWFQGAPDLATYKQQPWNVRAWYHGVESIVTDTHQAGRSRFCPVGFLMVTDYANGSPPPERRCERNRVPACTGNCPTSAPVLPFAQEKRLSAVDFRAGDLELVRYYNSQSRYTLDVHSKALLGPRWATNWESRLEAFSGSSVRVLRPEGTQIQFTLNAGVWTAWKGEATTLTAVSSPPPGMAAWLLRDRDDRIEAFAAGGELLYIEHTDGRRFDLSYDTDGRLQSVTARDGRSLVFSWSTVYYGSYPRYKRLSAVNFPDGSAVSYSYDEPTARLTSVSDANGTRMTYLYNEVANSSATGRDRFYLITGVLDSASSRYSTYKYGSTGLVTESGLAVGANLSAFALGGNYVDITSSTGIERRVFTLTAGAQRVTQITRRTCSGCAVSMSRTISYGSNGYINLETDFNGSTTDHDYDARGLETVRIEAQGKDTQPSLAISDERKIENSWHASYRVPTERRSYRCSAPNATAQACNTAASTRWQLEALSRFTYNARGQVTARCEVDPGNGTAAAYSCGSSTNAPTGVRQTLTSYCEAGDIAAGSCPLLGLVTATNGARTDVTDTTVLTYYGADHASCALAPTTCAYRKGDLWKVSNALGHFTEYLAYDGAGRVLRIKDANGVISDMAYHARGWLLNRTVRVNTNGTPNATLDATTTLRYDGDGLVTRVTQPDGAFIDYTYDAAHRLTDITDSVGNKISYTLDAAGNRTAESTRDPSSTLTRTLGRIYDSLGRMQKLLNAQNAETVFTYDANGNQNTVTDALTRVTDSDVDPLNRLIQSTDALMGSTKYRYDARDNLVQVTDAKNLSTQYVYNGLSDLAQLVSPDTGTTGYTYDAAGNRATQTDARGVVSTYGYDALNRLTGIGYPTSSNNVAFSYDQNHSACAGDEQFGIGRLTGFTDPSGSTQLCYDRRGNVKRKVAVVNSITQTTAWSYNTADRMTQLVYPSGSVTNYTRDALGRIDGISVTPSGGSAQTLISAVSYYPFGPVKQITWGNGATSLRSYDQNYWIDQIDSSQTTGLDLDFTLDAVGNITGLSDALGGTPPNNTYTYDALYRLADIDTPSSNVETYTYDPIGNRLSKLVGAASAAMPYIYPGNSHRLSSVDGVSRAYDANGNTTTQNSGANVGFVYDERNRLAARQVSSSDTHLYSHNGRGERVLKVDIGTSANSRLNAYDEAGRLILEADASGAALQEYLWLDDLPVGLLTGGVLHHIQPDHLGSPRKVVRASDGAIVWDWPILNNPFGEAAPNQDPDGNAVPVVLNLRFPGQYFDAETGLHYNYFRDYEAGTGRYVESDPIGLRGGVNTFGYVGNRPLVIFDRKGLELPSITRLYQPPIDTRPRTCRTVNTASLVGSSTSTSYSSYYRTWMPATISWNGLWEFGLSISRCCKPIGGECRPGDGSGPRNPNDPDSISIGVGRFLGLSFGKEEEECINFGFGIGPPINWSNDA